MRNLTVVTKPKALTLYHGTTKEAAERIKSKGLRAVKEKNYNDLYYFDANRTNSVYLVDNLAEALSWAMLGYYSKVSTEGKYTDSRFRKAIRLCALATYAVVEFQVPASGVLKDERVPDSEGTVRTKPLPKTSIKNVTYYSWPEANKVLKKAGYKRDKNSRWPAGMIDDEYNFLKSKK